jgi:putative ABC transport system permease protein
MFLRFLKTTFRVFYRERIYFLLNILGLSCGITVALVILLYLHNDLTYDLYHKNAKNIYRVNSIYVSSGKENKFSLSPVSFGPRIQEEYPEIRAFVRIAGLGKAEVELGTEKFFEDEIYIADSTVFDIFTPKFLLGNPKSCLRTPNSIVLTEKLARKYFKNKNPLGENLVLNKSQTFQVTGVIKDLPDNIHLHYTALIPLKLYDPTGESKNASFYNIDVYTYLLLPEKYNPDQFYEKFPAFYEKYAAKEGAAYNQQYKAVIQPFLDIHFSNGWQYDLPNGNKIYIIAFLVIGLLILSLACINYLNMSIARADRRRKEIATKKILGSTRVYLIFQFLGESMITTIIAMVLALGMTEYILGYTTFNQLINKDLQVDFAHNMPLLLGVPLLTIFVSLASGMYPAFYLSQVNALKCIQGEKGDGLSRGLFRKSLVVMQMIISIGVTICTLAFGRQLDYVRTKDLGINRQNLLIIPIRDTMLISHAAAFKERLLQNPAIEAVSSAYNIPGGDYANMLFRAETDNGMEEVNFPSIYGSYDYIRTMGITLLQGRDFSREIPSDFRSAFIINETLARKMGWKEPLGKRMQQSFDMEGKPYFDGVVIGVVKDFNYASLHHDLEPVVLRLQNRDDGQMLIRLKGTNMTETLKYIETTWNSTGSEFPTDYTFLDENFKLLYLKDQQQNMLVRIFSWICIMISCLGLLSLSSYIMSNRTKEIMIRKVMGASVNRITLLLYREILTLVLIAVVIASPLSYWLSQKLLNNFAYKVGIKPDIFLIALVGAIILALGTVSYHSLKVAFSNPAEYLKYE